MKIWMKTFACVPLLALSLGVISFGARAQAQDHRDHGRQDHRQFDDHDRQQVHSWMDRHHDHPPVGFRSQDRLPANLESGLRVGVVLGPQYRRRIHPVPHDLLVTLAPPPPHYRYVIIGDHLCLIDSGYHVSDILHLELNF